MLKQPPCIPELTGNADNEQRIKIKKILKHLGYLTSIFSFLNLLQKSLKNKTYLFGYNESSPYKSFLNINQCLLKLMSLRVSHAHGEYVKNK
jgi:hypothetical protein